MKRKKMEKEVVHLLEWIIEYPGVWQIVCNPDGKETSPESFKMAYDMLVKKSLFYLIPVLFATHPGEESLEMAKNLCTADSAAARFAKNGMECVSQMYARASGDETGKPYKAMGEQL